MTTPCDYPDSNGVHHCPYEGWASESEMCRVCCGLGVDENYEKEDYDYGMDDM